jgi:hypothetical protein
MSVFPAGAEKHNVVANNKKEVQNTCFTRRSPSVFYLNSGTTAGRVNVA